ncbi:MAG: PP2C family serine/threonine-protein phosphatase [Polyangiaceae bacterium]
MSYPAWRPTVRSFAKSDIGRHRKINEDAFFRDDQIRLFIVADGMGGHAAGEIASGEAVDTVHGMVKRGLGGLGDLYQSLSLDEVRSRAACRLLEGAIQAATYMVFGLAQYDKDKSGMGTTITCALVVGDSLVTGQVGDSRIYRVRQNQAVQLTEDHTLIAWQLKQGLISENEARNSPHKNVITRAVGNREYVEVDTNIYPLASGDKYMLCSDGLHGYLQVDEVAAVASIGGDSAVDQFIALANNRGGKDNITCLLVEVA